MSDPRRDHAPPGHVVVVGGSRAGLCAVETARGLGYTGRLTLVGAETHLPYDRPPLSKQLLEHGPTSTHHLLPGSERLTTALDVTVRSATAATGLDLAARSVQIDGGEGDDGEVLSYDALLVATGVRPRTLPGQDDLAGVHRLRTVDDAVAIHRALQAGARTVIVGAGFIGAEVASAATRRGLRPTIVESASTPLARAVGPVAGHALATLHERHGVALRCNVGVAEIVGDGRVEAVCLTDGTELAADLVVVGIGAVPNTEWLAGSGLPLADGVVCDARLQAAPGVWAAGDVARWHNPLFERPMRLEHWTNAGEQAAHAMTNLLCPEQATDYAHVPYFWSDWYGHRIQFAGMPAGRPEIVSGDWDADSFVALYRDGSRLVGVLTLDRRGDIMKYRAMIGRRGTWDAALDLAARRSAAVLPREASTSATARTAS